MAYDKIVDSALLNANLRAIANAIRSKSHNEALIPWNQMAAAIDDLEMVDYTKESRLLYELPEPTIFNGVDTYIDTGIQLMKEACDFTILVDFVSEAAGILFHCMHEVSPFPGICMQKSAYASHSNKWQVGYFDATRYVSISPTSGNRCRLAASISGRNTYVLSAYDVTQESTITTGNITTYTDAWSAMDETLLIGAGQNASGVKNRFWKGSLYDFKVVKRSMGAHEINTYFQTGLLNYGLPAI